MSKTKTPIGALMTKADWIRALALPAMEEAIVEHIVRAVGRGKALLAKATPAKRTRVPLAVAEKRMGKAKATRAAKTPARGQKRAPGDIDRLTDRLRQAIAAQPGLGIEAIGKAMDVPTKALKLPVKRLLDDKSVTTKGQKRATRYFPAPVAVGAAA